MAQRATPGEMGAIAVLIVAAALIVGCILANGTPAANTPPSHPFRGEPAPHEIEPTPARPDCPDGRCPLRPGPRRPRVSYRLPSAGSAVAGSVIAGQSYRGEILAAPFQAALWMENVASKLDDAGMCVDTSGEMLARYLGLDYLRGFRDEFAAHEVGGGDPERLEDQLTRWCRAKGVPVPPFVSYYGPDPAPLLEQLDAAGLPYAHSLGHNPRYRNLLNPSGEISHMVVGVKFSRKYAVDVDNNEVGGLDVRAGRIYEWTDRAEALSRMKLRDGNTWVFAFLVPPPPPHPRLGV